MLAGTNFLSQQTFGGTVTSYTPDGAGNTMAVGSTTSYTYVVHNLADG
jgi:hypothetical protein